MAQHLKIPHEVENDPGAREILRVWSGEDAQRFALRVDVWNDPASWGILFVDLARHIANAYAQKYNADPEQILSQVKAGIDAEWENPSDGS